MMKNSQLSPKMSCLLEFSAEIWTLLGAIISIQNLILLWVLQLGPNAKFWFCLQIIGLKNVPISQPRIATKSLFLASGCFF